MAIVGQLTPAPLTAQQRANPAQLAAYGNALTQRNRFIEQQLRLRCAEGYGEAERQAWRSLLCPRSAPTIPTGAFDEWWPSEDQERIRGTREALTRRREAVTEARNSLLAQREEELARVRLAQQQAREAGREDIAEALEPEIRRLTPQTFPPPEIPTDVVAKLLEYPHWSQDGCALVHRYRGDWWQWCGVRWAPVQEETVRSSLYADLEHATYPKDMGADGVVDTRWAPSRSKVDNVVDALKAHRAVQVDSSRELPFWPGIADDDPRAARRWVSCRNVMVDTTTGATQPHTPHYFTTVALPFDYDPDAGEPSAWLAFLRTVWPDDEESIRLLQQWFGYVLSGQRHHHKIMLLVGKPRSGKGTIATVLQKLIGEGNYCGPTLTDLTTQFGLAPLIHTPLAVVGDARTPDRDKKVVLSRLLSISGGDALTVDRKHKDPWTGLIPARIFILSNELPNFTDDSGAFASRFLILRTGASFYGREDTGLEARLEAELAAIFSWALTGLADLEAAGRFVLPRSSGGLHEEMERSVSLLGRFWADCCQADPSASVPVDDVHRALKHWCQEEGYRVTPTKAALGRYLKTEWRIENVQRRKGEKEETGGPRKRIRCYVGMSLSEEGQYHALWQGDHERMPENDQGHFTWE